LKVVELYIRVPRGDFYSLVQTLLALGPGPLDKQSTVTYAPIITACTVQYDRL